MQTRHRAAATALLLTAATGLAAATGGTAQASGTHTGHRAAPKLVIKIHDRKSGITLSDSKFRPGNTIFKIPAHGKGGDLQVLRLKPGYTQAQAFADFATLNSNTPDIKAVRRIDRNVVFYGGNHMNSRGGGPNFWAVKIDKASKYYVLDIAPKVPRLTTFKAKGAKQRRSLPAQDGWINPVTSNNAAGNDFRAGKHNAASGWMSTTNKAKEPHFVDLQQVKKGTTDADITHALNGTGPDPSIPGGGTAGTGVISPGHSFLWSYNLPKGRYAALCFWPSKMNGMPHALMGMHAVFNLH